MSDRVEKIGESILQHGKLNDRIYLMHLAAEDFPGILSVLGSICDKEHYSKIFAKVPARFGAAFLADGYRLEAYVPGFFQGEEDAFFMARYFASWREEIPVNEMNVFQGLLNQRCERKEIGLDPVFTYRKARESDAETMAVVYREVFPSYPFPIHDPVYLVETMRSHVIYHGIWEGDKLVALSSAETDREELNAEMTDFAVLPEYRGKSFGRLLLRKMEEDVRALGIRTAYTIARLKSPGMNATFRSGGYRYSGTLINNTNISGGFESMNVWYKWLE